MKWLQNAMGHSFCYSPSAVRYISLYVTNRGGRSMKAIQQTIGPLIQYYSLSAVRQTSLYATNGGGRRNVVPGRRKVG